MKSPEDEQGHVIACVMLSKHGDVLVDYHDNVARHDEMAQEAIVRAAQQLRNYFREQQRENAGPTPVRAVQPGTPADA